MLDLSGNKFQGSIPGSVDRLKHLMVLNLSGNAFSNSIPESIGRWFKSTIVDLSKRNLSGCCLLV